MSLKRGLVLLLAFVSCVAPSAAPYDTFDSTPPRLVRSAPAAGDTGVDPELHFEATFDELVDARTLLDNIKLVGNGQEWPICLNPLKRYFPCCPAHSACVPRNPCHEGTISCDTGSAVCIDTTVAISGASAPGCSGTRACFAGACELCVAGTPCITTANRCQLGKTVCGSSGATCDDSVTTEATDGTVCGVDQSCTGGQCSCAPGKSCTAPPVSSCGANEATVLLRAGRTDESGTDCAKLKLPPGTYTVQIGTGLTDAFGNHLEQPQSVSFTTR